MPLKCRREGHGIVAWLGSAWFVTTAWLCLLPPEIAAAQRQEREYGGSVVSETQLQAYRELCLSDPEAAARIRASFSAAALQRKRKRFSKRLLLARASRRRPRGCEASTRLLVAAASALRRARRDERGRACEAARGNGNWRACIAPLACPAPQTAEMPSVAPSALLRKFLILQQHIRKRPCAV